MKIRFCYSSLQDLNTIYRFDIIEDIAALRDTVPELVSLKTSEIKWGCSSYVDLRLKAEITEHNAMSGRIRVCVYIVFKYYRFFVYSIGI